MTEIYQIKEHDQTLLIVNEVEERVNFIVTERNGKDGFTTLADKIKLDGIEAGAEVNNISDVDATDLTDGGDTTLHTHDGRYYTESETDTLLSSKSNTGHTHTASNIPDFQASVSSNSDVTSNTSARHTHANQSILNAITESFTTALKSAYDSAVSWISTNGANLIGHLANTSNPHSVSKSQVGLGNVDNTSDADKPVSSATQTALNGKANTLHTHTKSDITDFSHIHPQSEITDLVTDLAGKAASVHNHAISDTAGLQTALDNKVDENAAITGATKTKITYDAKGLVTAGADATTADIADSADKRYVTDAQQAVIGNTSGTNTGDQNDHGLMTGLADDDHSIYAFLAGRASGQTIIGGTGVTDALTLKGTSGNGTLTEKALRVLVGNNGATEAFNIKNDGVINTGKEVIIGGATGNAGILSFFNSGVRIQRTAASGMQFDTGGSTKMTLLSTGELGFGTATPTAKFEIVAPTLTGSSATSALSITQTWNTTGSPTAIFANITNTASGANSRLIDLQVGGNSLFNVTKAGTINLLGSNVGLSYYGSGVFFNSSGRDLDINIIGTSCKLRLTGTPSIEASITDYSSYGILSTINASVNSQLLNGQSITNVLGFGAFSGVAYNGIRINTGFAPTSGTHTYVGNLINPTINQTGGANGITRGLYVNPTLTAAADFRAIETNSVANIIVIGKNTGRVAMEVTSTTQGFLPPRMTTAQRDAIATVAGDAGLTIFNTTTTKLEVWDGAAWQQAW